MWKWWKAAGSGLAWMNIWNGAMWLKMRSFDRKSRSRWETYFNEEWYLSQNPDVNAFWLSPALHYLFFGFRERRQPGPNFNGTYYLDRHPDVRASGVNPLMHWSIWGFKENRPFAPILPSDAFLDAPSEDTVTARVRPLVSVVITSFNYGHYLAGSIDSVLNQSFSNLEIIVVEGGSTDPESVQRCRELEERLKGSVSFHYRSEPRLAGDNRNAGIHLARGRYICCLDADDILLPTYIEAAAFLLELLRLDFVSSSIQSIGDSDLQWRITDPHWPGILSENQVSTTAVFRKSMWTQVGGYRDWGKGPDHVPEDWDLWIRAIGNGFRGASISRPLLQYRVHAGSLSSGSGSSDNARWSAALRGSNPELAGLPAPLPRPVSPEVAADRESMAVHRPEGPCVLFALPFLTTGGAEKIFETLIQSIVDRGGRALIVTTLELAPGIPDRTAEFESLTPYVYPLPALFPSRPEVWGSFVLHLIRAHGVDSIFLAGSDFIYRTLPRIKLEFPGVAVADQLFNAEVHYPTNRLYRDYIDITIVPSEDFANHLISEGRENRHRIAVVPHGVHMPEEFIQDPASAAASAILPEGFKGKKIVSFFGRLSPEKGPLDFLLIAKKLSRRGDVRFCMTGEGPLREQVQARIRELRLDDVLYAPGFVPDPTPYIAASTVVVVPSNLDGMPLIIFEAQLLSRPVVASRVGSVPNVVEDGVTGFLCQPADINQFVDTISAVLDSEELARSVGEQGRDSAKSRYSAPAMVSGYTKSLQAAKANARGDWRELSGS